MDDPGVPPAELGRALAYIRGVNRRLGGVDALVRHLRSWSGAWRAGETITMLDVATGSADLPIAARRWAATHGFTLAITAIDRHEETLRFAREHMAKVEEEETRTQDLGLKPGAPKASNGLARVSAGTSPIELRRVDALELDAIFPPASFDYVHAGLFLHHLNDANATRVLASMWRLARRGIVWNDLVRSRAGHAFIRAATIGQPRMVRHDAAVSVLAGFSRREALALAHRASIPDDRTRYRWNLFTHRFTLTATRAP
jgi:hypothetical protein